MSPAEMTANPDTIITVMIKTQELTEEIGQGVTLFTADQHILLNCGRGPMGVPSTILTNNS